MKEFLRSDKQCNEGELRTADPRVSAIRITEISYIYSPKIYSYYQDNITSVITKISRDRTKHEAYDTATLVAIRPT